MNEPMMGGQMDEDPNDSGMGGGDYVIEIRVSGGSLTVSSEPIKGVDGAEEAGEAQGQPVKSIGEAVKLVMDIYENGGELGAGEDDFTSGFDGGSSMREGE